MSKKVYSFPSFLIINEEQVIVLENNMNHTLRPCLNILNFWDEIVQGFNS